MTDEIERPEFVTDEMLDYLDQLRESGVTNMSGGGAYLDLQFPDLRDNFPPFQRLLRARAVLSYWMKTFPRVQP